MFNLDYVVNNTGKVLNENFHPQISETIQELCLELFAHTDDIEINSTSDGIVEITGGVLLIDKQCKNKIFPLILQMAKSISFVSTDDKKVTLRIEL